MKHLALCLIEIITSVRTIIQTVLCVGAMSLQLYLILCNPMDCSRPGSSVHGILQARILEWVAISSSRGSSWHRDRTWISYVSCMGRQVFTTSATWEAPRQWQSSASETPLISTSSLASPPTWSFICLSVTSALNSQLLGSTPLCLMILSTHIALIFSSSAPWVWNLNRQALNTPDMVMQCSREELVSCIILAALGLRCCARAFSTCSERDSHFSGFSCCRTWALGHMSSVVAAPGP